MHLNLVGPTNNLHNTRFIPTSMSWTSGALDFYAKDHLKIWKLKHILRKFEMHFEATIGT